MTVSISPQLAAMNAATLTASTNRGLAFTVTVDSVRLLADLILGEPAIDDVQEARDEQR
jgi:hypothetical protein